MDQARWLTFLSDASKVLSASLDYAETLESIAHLAVPELADWCDLLTLEADGAFHRATVLHRDPARLELAREYARRWPVVRVQGVGAAPPLTSGRPHLIPHLTDERLAAVARDAEELAMLRSFGLTSIMMCPLIARRRTIGMLILATAESGRVFSVEEVALAEDLASRAAMAVDNARLYQAEKEARAEVERTLKARIESERQLQAVLDHSPAIIYVSDREGRLTLVNRYFERRMQRSSAEMLGRTFFDLVPAEEAARGSAHDQSVMRENRPMQFEAAYTHEGTTYTWFSLKFPIQDENGQAVGVCGISTDITERKLAEEALRSSQEQFEKVFRASTVAIAIIHRGDGRFIQVNPACEKLTGYRAEEMIGRTSDELGCPVRLDDRERALEILATEGRVSGFETTLPDRFGVVHDVLMSVERIEVAGQPCMLTVTHDITEMKRLKERLAQAQRMESLGRLAGGVAHDFNNILTAISGYSGLVMEASPEGSLTHESSQHIQRAALRAEALIKQLLVFGRRQVQKPAEVELNPAVSGLLTMLRRLIDEDICLQVSLSPEVGGVEIDPAQLEQVIFNLTLNARDAMPTGGQLRIQTALVQGEVRLRVEDDGIGMDEPTRARIFEPFFTTKEVGKGTGLGLATVYSIVEQAGGRITVESAPGKGARFDVFLPRSSRTAPAPGPGMSAPAPPAEIQGGQETLLLVEDDEAVRDFACLVLKQARYTVLAASDGESALRVAATHPGRIDLLLTDIVMPHRNGRALAAELQRITPSLRVMYMSGYPGDSLQRYDDIPSSDSFVQKPFTRETLLAMVAEALRR